MRSLTGSLTSCCVYAAIITAGLAAGRAGANMIGPPQVFTIANQKVGDGDHLADATISFGLSNGQLTVSLDNTSSMHAANELIRSVSFKLFNSSRAITATGQLTALHNGRQEKINKNGSYTFSSVTLGGLADPWRIRRNSSAYILGTGGAKDMVIAPPVGNAYRANKTIDGNPRHNPFLADTPTFNMQLCGINSVTQVRDVMVGFGTGSLNVPASETSIPEPAAAALLAVGGLVLLLKRKRSR